jgi:hypothetical protein
MLIGKINCLPARIFDYLLQNLGMMDKGFSESKSFCDIRIFLGLNVVERIQMSIKSICLTLIDHQCMITIHKLLLFHSKGGNEK